MTGTAARAARDMAANNTMITARKQQKRYVRECVWKKYRRISSLWNK
jgi:hypothetical protein